MKRAGCALLLLLSLPSMAAEDAPRVAILEPGQPAPARGCFIREPSCIDLAQELTRRPREPQVVEVQPPGGSTLKLIAVAVASFAAGVTFALKLK